jgi:hypothetical protein
MSQAKLIEHAIDELAKLTFSGRAWQSKFGGKVDGLSGSCGSLEGVVLCHKGNVLSDMNVGGVNRIIVQADIGLDGQGSTRRGATGKNVQKACLSSATGTHYGSGLFLGDFSPNIIEEFAIGFALLSFLRIREKKVSDITPR